MPLSEEFKKNRGWYYTEKDKYYWHDCDYCGEEYQGMGKFYCSKSCKLKDNPIYDLQEVHPMKIPEIAQKVSDKLKGRKLSPEMREVAIKALRDIVWTEEMFAYRKSCMPKGKDHWRWIEDRSKVVNRRGQLGYTGEYKEWMLSIKNRDGWKCRINNQDCNGQLEAHHILNFVDYPELRYDINNGITLCHAHHPRGRAEEKRQETYLISLVSVSKE